MHETIKFISKFRKCFEFRNKGNFSSFFALALSFSIISACVHLYGFSKTMLTPPGIAELTTDVEHKITEDLKLAPVEESKTTDAVGDFEVLHEMLQAPSEPEELSETQQRKQDLEEKKVRDEHQRMEEQQGERDLAALAQAAGVELDAASEDDYKMPSPLDAENLAAQYYENLVVQMNQKEKESTERNQQIIKIEDALPGIQSTDKLYRIASQLLQKIRLLGAKKENVDKWGFLIAGQYRNNTDKLIQCINGSLGFLKKLDRLKTIAFDEQKLNGELVRKRKQAMAAAEEHAVNKETQSGILIAKQALRTFRRSWNIVSKDTRQSIVKPKKDITIMIAKAKKLIKNEFTMFHLASFRNLGLTDIISVMKVGSARKDYIITVIEKSGAYIDARQVVPAGDALKKAERMYPAEKSTIKVLGLLSITDKTWEITSETRNTDENIAQSQ